MNCKQNLRINQVTEKTLVIGVDIAKEVQYARAFDHKGLEIAGTFRFTADHIGFGRFLEWVVSLKKNNAKNKIIVGLEPTGQYWLALARMLRLEDISVVQVNPYHVKVAGELDDGIPSKNDKKDAKTIAMLIKDGRYRIPYLPKGIYSELRNASTLKNRIDKEKTRIKNHIQRLLDEFFPEYGTVYSDIFCQSSLMLLEKYPFPSMLCGVSHEDIVTLWRTSIRCSVGIRKAKALLNAAKTSIGVTEGLETAYLDMTFAISDYKNKQKMAENIKTRLEEMLEEVKYSSKIYSIKGIGKTSAACLIAEAGDLKRFESSKQLIKYAGLNITARSSGYRIGKGKTSKRGRSSLRSLLFMISLSLVKNNEAFRKLHNYNTTARENPLTKMKSIMAISRKILMIVHSMVINDTEFNPELILCRIAELEKTEKAA